MCRLSESDLYCVAMKIPPQSRVDAIAQHEVDDAVGAPEEHSRFGPVLRQRVEAFAGSARQHNHDAVVKGGLHAESAPVPHYETALRLGARNTREHVPRERGRHSESGKPGFEGAVRAHDDRWHGPGRGGEAIIAQRLGRTGPSTGRRQNGPV